MDVIKYTEDQLLQQAIIFAAIINYVNHDKRNLDRAIREGRITIITIANFCRYVTTFINCYMMVFPDWDITVLPHSRGVSQLVRIMKRSRHPTSFGIHYNYKGKISMVDDRYNTGTFATWPMYLSRTFLTSQPPSTITEANLSPNDDYINLIGPCIRELDGPSKNNSERVAARIPLPPAQQNRPTNKETLAIRQSYDFPINLKKLCYYKGRYINYLGK